MRLGSSPISRLPSSSTAVAAIRAALLASPYPISPSSVLIFTKSQSSAEPDLWNRVSTFVIFTEPPAGYPLRPRLVEDLLQLRVQVVEELLLELLIAVEQAAQLLLDQRVQLAAPEVVRDEQRAGLLGLLDPDLMEWVGQQARVVEGVRAPAAGAGCAAPAFAEPDAGLLVAEHLGELPRLLLVLAGLVDHDEVDAGHRAPALARADWQHRVLDLELVLDPGRQALGRGSALVHGALAGHEHRVLRVGRVAAQLLDGRGRLVREDHVVDPLDAGDGLGRIDGGLLAFLVRHVAAVRPGRHHQRLVAALGRADLERQVPEAGRTPALDLGHLLGDVDELGRGRL